MTLTLEAMSSSIAFITSAVGVMAVRIDALETNMARREVEHNKLCGDLYGSRVESEERLSDRQKIRILCGMLPYELALSRRNRTRLGEKVSRPVAVMRNVG